MGVDTLLYVTDLKDRDASLNIFKRSIPLQKERYGKIVFFLPFESDGWQDAISSFELDYVIRKADDFSADNIIKAAEEEGSALIIVDMDGDGRTVSDLVAKSPIPLLLMNRSGQEKELFEHVIIATDWTPFSRKALTFALDFKELIGELDMIHVINNKLTVKGMRDLKVRLAETRKICLNKGIDAEFHIYAGKTGEEILTAAKDYRGTIIILGAPVDRSLVKRLFQRGVKYDVAGKSDIPVFLIPKTYDRN
ncbi:MAG: universal stress protein [Thermodesulfobacteriota bacterium]|nr:universal stress protein [Thermodesulfobacteriota bacterium]